MKKHTFSKLESILKERKKRGLGEITIGAGGVVTVDDMDDFTPEARLSDRELAKAAKKDAKDANDKIDRPAKRK